MLLPAVSLVGTIILMVWFRTESLLLLKVAPALVGTIILIVWFCGRGTRGPNRFGPVNGVP
jgi:uncharacterized membrane protein YhaH (DUF805 family)